MQILVLLLTSIFASSAFGQAMFFSSNVPHVGVAKYTQVGSPSTHETGASSTCLTPSTSHTAGHLLVLTATSFGTANTVSGVTSSAGDAFTAAANTFISFGTLTKQSVIYYKLIAIGSATDVVTINWNIGGNSLSCTVVEYSYSGTASYDVGQNGSASTSMTVTSSSFTAATSSNLNIAIGMQVVGAVNGWSAGPGYTLLQNTGTGVNAEVEYRNPAPSGAQTAAITYSTGASDMQISVASFK